MYGKYTTIGVHSDLMIDVIKIDLTRSIGTLSEIHEEAGYAIFSSIGECEDWTPVEFYPKALRIVATLSARKFVGYPLCRNEEWIDLMIRYTVDAFACVQAISKL